MPAHMLVINTPPENKQHETMENGNCYIKIIIFINPLHTSNYIKYIFDKNISISMCKT